MRKSICKIEKDRWENQKTMWKIKNSIYKIEKDRWKIQKSMWKI